MSELVFFILLPYLALFSLIAGSIARYWFQRFSVSSLSSQLLESKLLFFGSRPFHWGIVTLLFGHLAGFLFPGTVLAWNGRPVRLYILEISAFALGITCLIGLIVLIIRRSKIKRIRSVTSPMDIILFIVLTGTILTGLYTAFFARWGSSWFAMVLAPYLWSVITFRPDAIAVMAMPVMVKIHLISTFIFFAILPYTRMIHVFAYPIAYFWRNYQVVIWNRRKIPEGSVSRIKNGSPSEN